MKKSCNLSPTLSHYFFPKILERDGFLREIHKFGILDYAHTKTHAS